MGQRKLLNSTRREALKAFVKKNAVASPAKIKERDAAYIKAEKAVTAAVRKHFPQADINTLKKYNLTTKDSCLRIQSNLAEADIVYFDYLYDNREFAQVPEIPRTQSCRSGAGVIPDYKSAAELVAKYNDLKKISEDERNQMLRDFYALINTAKNFDQLVTVWPKFSELENQLFDQTGLIEINDEVKNRIGNYAVAA